MSDIKLGDKVITGVNEIQVQKANAPAGEKATFHENIITSVANTVSGNTLTTTVTGSDGVAKSGSVNLPVGSKISVTDNGDGTVSINIITK